MSIDPRQTTCGLRQMVTHDIVAMTRNAYGCESRNYTVGHHIGGTIRAEPMIIPELFDNSLPWPCLPSHAQGRRNNHRSLLPPTVRRCTGPLVVCVKVI